MPTEAMGPVLFHCAKETFLKDLKNLDAHLAPLKAIRDRADNNVFDTELVIMILFAAFNVVMENTLYSEDTKFKILDGMHGEFIKAMSQSLKPTDDKEFYRKYLMSRYKEYSGARNEKRGPNELWPLSQHILKNLLGKETLDDETKDVESIMALSVYYSGNLKYFNNIMQGIEVKH